MNINTKFHGNPSNSYWPILRLTTHVSVVMMPKEKSGNLQRHPSSRLYGYLNLMLWELIHQLLREFTRRWTDRQTNIASVARNAPNSIYMPLISACVGAHAQMCVWIWEYMLPLPRSPHQHAHLHSELMMSKTHPTISRQLHTTAGDGETAPKPQYRGLFIRSFPSQHTDYLSYRGLKKSAFHSSPLVLSLCPVAVPSSQPKSTHSTPDVTFYNPNCFK